MTKILTILSTLLISACSMDYMLAVHQAPPTAEESYKKIGVDIQGTKQALRECNYNQHTNPNLSNDAKINTFFKAQFCMEDKGFRLSSGSTALDGCRNLMSSTKKKIPICITRGALSE